MKIAVMGAGGQGGLFGGLLAKAGEDLTLITRGAHLEAIRSWGLRLKSDQDEAITITVNATSDPAELGPVDLLLFCVTQVLLLKDLLLLELDCILLFLQLHNLQNQKTVLNLHHAQ